MAVNILKVEAVLVLSYLGVKGMEFISVSAGRTCFKWRH